MAPIVKVCNITIFISKEVCLREFVSLIISAKLGALLHMQLIISVTGQWFNYNQLHFWRKLVSDKIYKLKSTWKLWSDQTTSKFAHIVLIMNNYKVDNTVENDKTFHLFYRGLSSVMG